MGIPDWTAAGILPPVQGGLGGTTPDRSPYITTMPDLVSRFATTVERYKVLEGLLRYREALHELGLTSGFQWLDGSFAENIEVTASRPPRDIDVVTFFQLPQGVATQAELMTLNPELFTNAKQDFKVDAYYLQVGQRTDENVVKRVAYWYGVWSHRRDTTWKGFLQVSLSPALDAEALGNLQAIAEEGGWV